MKSMAGGSALGGLLPNTPDDTNDETDDTDDNADTMIHPLKKIVHVNSEFGKRTRVKGYNGRMSTSEHGGIDLRTASGSKVFAPYDGKVVRSEDLDNKSCGGHIKIKHGDIYTKYCHLRSRAVKTGERVKKGDIIGYSGGSKNDPHSGTSTGSHLHYAIVVNNDEVDPRNYTNFG